MSDNGFKAISSREYWINGQGEKMYPHHFEDEHLINTILLMKRNALTYRIEEARAVCERYYNIRERHLSANQFYGYYKDEVDKFIDMSVSHEQWLQDNSKIFMLLVEEANYRGLEIKESEPQQPKGKFKFTYNFNKIWSS